jgi:hypothetical protein
MRCIHTSRVKPTSKRVGERPAADGCREIEQRKPGDGTREPGPGKQGLGGAVVPLGDELLGAQFRGG